MDAAAMKLVTSNFSKLDKFERVDFKRWQKKMHFLLSSGSVVYVLTTPIPDDGGHVQPWDNEDYVYRGLIHNGMSDFLFDIYQNVESPKELRDSLEAKYMAEDASRDPQEHDSDKPKGNNVASPSIVNVVKHNNSSRYNDNKGKCKHHDNTRVNPNKKSKVTCWKCGKPRNLKKDCKGVNAGNKSNGSGTKGSVDGSSNSLKGQNMFNKSFRVYYVTYVSVAYLVQDDDVAWFCYVYLLHSKDEALDKFKIFKTEVELQQGSQIKRFRTNRGGLSQGFWGEAMLIACYLLNRVPNKRKKITLYELWTKRKLNMNYHRVWGCRAVMRLHDPKLKTLGGRGIECIFVGYAEHFKAFRDEDDPKTFDEAIKSQDVAFWKEKINDEMDSIMGNNTWVLADPPLGCRPFVCKWIFKRKIKVDETFEKLKARLVIQSFKQKSGIDYFNTYPSVARISTIRLLIAMASIHNLIIHQMDVKTAFLNGDLDEEVYMNQPQGFIIPGNENKACKLIKSLYGLKQAPKQWHQKFNEVVLSNGYLLNQADKYVYRKFDETGKEVIICLYVDDMLIYGTDQVQVDLIKEFLSSKFAIKDMGEADVILEIRAVSQLEYSRMIGCLMHAMTFTRPDIAFAVGKLSRYTSNPGSNSAGWFPLQAMVGIEAALYFKEGWDQEH
nr:zinc finger, CCHC-type [Tanacetum cinerariifolium]